MRVQRWLAIVVLGILSLPAVAAEEPKRGGTLTYLIPADAPPSFDGHRETTYATVHSVSPFYSVLIRINPENPSSTTDFVCDLCTGIPQPTDGGKTYTFKIRTDAKFTDGSPLSAADIAASWRMIIDPPQGITSGRQAFYTMVDKVEAPDPNTVVFNLKFATTAFLPALADPFAYIYKKGVLDKDPHWYEKNILGTGPFKFAHYETGQSITGVRNPDYYQPDLPYLDGFVAIYADKQATRVDAIRSDRAAIEFRGFPPTVRDELKAALGDKLAVQTSDWNCGGLNQWKGAPGLSKIAIVRTVAGIVFPGSPLAATKEELQQLAGFWPDIEKSRAEAKRLLKEAGAENLSFEMLNRDVDQPFKYVGTFVIDEWSKIGLKVTQKVVPTGPWFEGMRTGNFDVTMEANCQSVVNPVLDVSKYLPHTVFTENYGGYEDQAEIDLYEKMLHEPDPAKQRVLMREFEKYVVDTQAHELPLTFWYRIVPYRSYVKGWKISPSHFVNQDLATIWLDK